MPHAGPYTFASYEVLSQPGLSPPPSEATKLLHKLAADPGIVDVMRKNSWRVGKLSEMAPEGKEGISPMCILGVNINAGQEISLRLRTDDLKVRPHSHDYAASLNHIVRYRPSYKVKPQ